MKPMVLDAHFNEEKGHLNEENEGDSFDIRGSSPQMFSELPYHDADVSLAIC